MRFLKWFDGLTDNHLLWGALVYVMVLSLVCIYAILAGCW